MDTQSDLGEEGPASPRDVIIRDDQSDFSSLLDSAKAFRKNRGRLKLVDSGKFSAFELERLGKAGADLYTSDQARQDLGEFIFIGDAAKKGGGIAAYFHHAAFELEAKANAVPFCSLTEMGRSGLYLYVSNSRFEREFSRLEELAYACAKGGSLLVYYHHGRLEPALESLCRQGAWTHVSGRSLQKEEDAVFLCDCIRAAGTAGANIVLHVESPINFSWLADIFKAGAIVFMNMPPSDYRSPQRPFELRAKRQKLDFRAYYLFSEFMI